MKILVISLLRLGDVIQQTSLLEGLKEKHPQAEVHLLVNKQFHQVEKILSGSIQKFFYFDREALQRGLGEAEFNILWSFKRLESLIQDLDQQNYDIVYNLTHNKLSAYLSGALNAKEKKGLHFEGGSFKGLDNQWFKYFNENFSGTQESLFNYTELLSHSFQIPVKAGVQRTATKSRLILFQCLTSDSKKNWSLASFAQLKKEIESCLNDYKVCVLGTPSEKEQLGLYFKEEDLLIADLAEVNRYLARAALLVTGDTSIKHMAVQMKTPLVEIALGSSDPSKTGADLQALVLSSSVPCAPCKHSQPCSQKSHLCGESISVMTVFTAVWDMLSGAERKQKISPRVFEREVWQQYLDQKEKNLAEFCKAHSKGEMIEFLKQCEAQTQELQAALNRAENALPKKDYFSQRSFLQSQDLSELIISAQQILKTKVDTAGYFRGFIESLTKPYRQPIEFYENVHQGLEESRQLLKIRWSSLNQLKHLSQEGEFYAKGFGHLSQIGFTEAGKSGAGNQQDAAV